MERSNTPSKFAVLLASQRRLAHFRTLIARNLVPADTGGVPVEFTFFRVLAEDGTVVYTSEATPDATNPIWLPMPSRDARAHPMEATHKLVFRIFSVPVCPHTKTMAESCSGRGACPRAVAEAHLLAEMRLDLRKLMHLSLNLREVPLADLPVNTVLIQLSDGYYGTQALWLALRQRKMILAPKADRETPAVLTVSECFGELRKVVDARSELKRLKERGAKAGTTVTRLVVEREEKESKALEIAAAKERIQQLRAKLGKKTSDVKRGRADVEARKAALVARSKALKALLARATPESAVRKAQDAHVTSERAEFFMARQLLTGRQLCMVSDIRSVYPITYSKRAGFSIRGAFLPDRDLYSHDDAQVSTALGHTAHLVALLAKYLQVPLRYAIRNIGSRSTICDALRKEPDLPLYFKGQDRARAEHACQLLDMDVVQLLEATGLHVPPGTSARTPVLAKLSRLLDHLLGPVMAFESQAGVSAV